MGNQESHTETPAILGVAGISCALLGLIAWIEYGLFATRGIFAASSHDMAAAYRMALYADGLHLAQLLLAVLAVGLGWNARMRGADSRVARRLGFSAVCVGGVVLALLLLLV